VPELLYPGKMGETIYLCPVIYMRNFQWQFVFNAARTARSGVGKKLAFINCFVPTEAAMVNLVWLEM